MRSIPLLLVVFPALVSIASGEQVECSYDDAKRLSELRLPDGSFIQYGYEGTLLKKISRKNGSGEELYTHCYDWDAQGRLNRRIGAGFEADLLPTSRGLI